MTLHLQSYKSQINKLETRTLKISQKTIWVFVELQIGDFVGTGEATLGGYESDVIENCHQMARQLNAGQLASFASNKLSSGPQKMPPIMATALSAIEQAVYDAESQKQNLPLGQLINPQQKPSNTTYYANINRGVTERTPEGFARAANLATNCGYKYIKFAPFDGISAVEKNVTNFNAALDHSVACIEAVHDIIQGKARFMIDCHSRFNLNAALKMLERIKNFEPYWIEEPIPEKAENISQILEFRQTANNYGILVAGLEKLYGRNRFQKFIDANIYDVILPDLRWCGGIEEFTHIANAVRNAGQSISFHNPSGPVLNAVTLQVARSMPDQVILECQFNESPAFYDIIETGRSNWKSMPNVSDLNGPGIGLTLSKSIPWDDFQKSIFE